MSVLLLCRVYRGHCVPTSRPHCHSAEHRLSSTTFAGSISSVFAAAADPLASDSESQRTRSVSKRRPDINFLHFLRENITYSYNTRIRSSLPWNIGWKFAIYSQLSQAVWRGTCSETAERGSASLVNLEDEHVQLLRRTVFMMSCRLMALVCDSQGE